MLNALKRVFDRELWQEGYFSYMFAVLSLVIIPIQVRYLPPFLMAWGLCRIVEFFCNGYKFSEIGRDIFLLTFGFFLYYIWIMAGLTYSKDIQNGTLILFRSLSLLVFPIILFSPGNQIKKNVKLLLKIFTIATIIYLLVCFVHAFYRSITIQDGNWIFNPHEPDYEWTNYFLGDSFTLFQHPSYVGMYIVLSMFVAFDSFDNKEVRKSQRILWLISSIFLLGSIYFLSSRAAYLAALVTLPLYLIIKLGKKRLNFLTIGIMVIILSVASYIFLTNQRVRFFFNDPQNSTLVQKVSMDFRIPIWKSAVMVIRNNMLLGVGIGDSSERLKKEFKSSGYVNGYYDNLNAHNQFLEILLASGLIGFLIFILILGMMAYLAIRNRNLLYGIFILMMLIFFMFESILNRLAGVSFFALFSFLLIYVDSGNLSIPNSKTLQD